MHLFDSNRRVRLLKVSMSLKLCKGDHTCQAGYSCINTPGAYRCEEIDECQDENICGQNSNCINTDGSYYCVCNDGYEGFVLFILGYNNYKILIVFFGPSGSFIERYKRNWWKLHRCRRVSTERSL